MDEAGVRAWLGADERTRPRAVICDLDETLCTLFDLPITVATELLRRLGRAVEVHYVTARTEQRRAGTEKFLSDHRLPGWKNLHLCPLWQSSYQHKRDVIARLAREYEVLFSIGDSGEEEEASVAAGVPFLRVDRADAGP